MMSKNCLFTEGMDDSMNRRPLLLLVYTSSLFAAHCSRYFRRKGWDVRMATCGDDLGAVVEALSPTAVVLGTGVQARSVEAELERIKQRHPGLNVVQSAADHCDWTEGGWNGGAASPNSNEDIERLAAQLLSDAMTPSV